MKANNTANQFAKELELELSTVKDGLDIQKVKEFIKNYPLPSGKEEMIEFIAGLNARRRTHSYYQKSYDAKYKECVTKAKVQFINDPQIAALLKETDRFSFNLLSEDTVTTLWIVGGVVFFFTLFIIASILGL